MPDPQLDHREHNVCGLFMRYSLSLSKNDDLL